MRFDDNNNNNNRILLEWKDFNLPLRKFISKMYPAVVKIEMQCVWNSIPGFSFPFLRENIPRIIRCAYAGLHFQLIFQVRDGKGMENMSALYHLSRVSWIIINSIVSCTPISNTNSYSFLTLSFLSLAPSRGNVSFNPSLNTRRPFDFYGRKLRALARILVFYIYIHTRVCTHNGELEGRD